MTHLSAFAFIGIVVHWLALWVGVYVASRRPRSKSAVLMGLAFVCGAVYILKGAYYFVPTTAESVELREEWLGGWIAFTPVLLLHSFLLLTESKYRIRRWVLAINYSMAALVFTIGLFDGLICEYGSLTLDPDGYLSELPPGRLYWVTIVQMVLPLTLSLVALLRARFDDPLPARVVRRQIEVLIVGMTLLTVGVVQILISGYIMAPVPDVVFFPVAVLGTAMLGVPLVRYSGRLGGQLLRSDAWSSLLATVIVLGLFVGAAAVAGALAEPVAGVGWLVVLVVVLGAELRAFSDRAVYGRAGRAARAELRIAEAYAGTGRRIDLDAITRGQMGSVVGYLSDLDRVKIKQNVRESIDHQWLRLLAREEFTAVRDALGVSEDWMVDEGLSQVKVYGRMKAILVPRERQALGLWYLGYSDKEMARLMGVKPGVPRSYLNEGKKKLGLPSGPALMLFVHLSGFVGMDALPLSGEECPQ